MRTLALDSTWEWARAAGLSEVFINVYRHDGKGVFGRVHKSRVTPVASRFTKPLYRVVVRSKRASP